MADATDLIKRVAKGAKAAGKGTPIGGFISGLTEGSGGTRKKRRRKGRLSRTDVLELNEIKNILGKTAAANALPYYLGRGR